ncbi:MAG: HEPN domain-containing protein [Paracoccaceae bacterium]
MDGSLKFSALKEKQRAIRAGFPETMGLRVHRAISWVGRSEACDGDDDARFLFLWIAFNAAYADEREFQSIAPGERAAFLDFFGKLVALDKDKNVYKALWQRFTGPVRLLMDNRFVFNPFWQHHNGIDGYEDWEARLNASVRSFNQAFRPGIPRVSSVSFSTASCPSQPTHPWRRDLEQRREQSASSRWRGHSGVSVAGLYRSYDG